MSVNLTVKGVLTDQKALGKVGHLLPILVDISQLIACLRVRIALLAARNTLQINETIERISLVKHDPALLR